MQPMGHRPGRERNAGPEDGSIACARHGVSSCNVAGIDVASPLEEAGVYHDEGLEAPRRHARRHGDGMLLGDPDIEDPVWEPLSKLQ